MIAPDLVSPGLFANKFPPSGQGVVIHSTRSGTSMNPTEFTGTLNWFNNPDSKVSSHWVIARDGRKARVIRDDWQSWHAGIHNATHWGIELEQGVESDGFTPEQMDALVAVCKGYVEMGVPPFHGMIGFIGHQDTPQGRGVGKSDPGSLFNWDWFFTQLRAEPPPPAQPYVTYVKTGFSDGTEWYLEVVPPR